MRIFDHTLGTLERALDARLLRHNVLAGNLANADTPGFVPQDLDFAAAMRDGAAGVPGDATPAPRPDGVHLVAYTPGLDARAGEIPLSLAGAPAAPGTPAIVAAQGTAAGLDGNAVDVDRALAAVAENAIQYGAAARAAQKKLAILRYAASDGNA